MRTHYVLIDYESIPVRSLDLLQEAHFRLRVFLGPNNSKLSTDLVIGIQRMGERADYIRIDAAGPNALDFHIAYYMGRFALEDPTASFHVISADKGFDPLLKYLESKGILATRSESIEAMPCFKELPALQATLAASAASAQAAKPVKKAPVKTGPANDAHLKTVMVDLMRRKASKPASTKTLISTIRATLGKDVSAVEADRVYQALCKRGFVKLKGQKVTYSLPERL